jgi:sulfite exporter TauE/SafE
LVQGIVRRALSGVLRSRAPLAPVALGVFNAFLPCQLIYAFAAQAASTASIAAGGLTMLAFGAGTVPAMLALGLAPSLLSPRRRAAVARAGAVLVIAYGALTIARGLFPGAGHAHRHAQAKMPTATSISAVSTSLMAETTALATSSRSQRSLPFLQRAHATAGGMTR